MISSTTSVKTATASRYLQQICKHFSHKIEVEFTPETGWIQFDFGKAELEASKDTLTIVAKANNQENLVRLQNVVASHLERFAFRETLVMDWSN